MLKFDRLERENYTIDQMIKIYCNFNHRSGKRLCDECRLLLEYASNRIQNCKFGLTKPACKKCSIHCYKEDMRQRIRKVMKYAGFKMLFYHPTLTIMHLLDSIKSNRR